MSNVGSYGNGYQPSYLNFNIPTTGYYPMDPRYDTAMQVLGSIPPPGQGYTQADIYNPNFVQRTGAMDETLLIPNPIAKFVNSVGSAIGGIFKGVSDWLQGASNQMTGTRTVEVQLDRNGVPLTVPGLVDRLPTTAIFSGQWAGGYFPSGGAMPTAGYMPSTTYAAPGAYTQVPNAQAGVYPGTGYMPVGSPMQYASTATPVTAGATGIMPNPAWAGGGRNELQVIMNAPLFSPDEDADLRLLKPEDQAMMRLQRKAQRYNLCVQCITNIFMMDHEAKKSIAQNIRG